jgi:glycosyltransferase involved in cell wall biosynthesis
MACGCPTVVSNSCSLPEICGDAAYYVDPYNVDSIAQGIYKVLTDEKLRQTLVRKGLERARLFTWERSVNELVKIFNEVASK